MDKNINLNLLKYFYEVVNEKNITRASKKLFVTQPNITRAIKELENELNAPLLKRSKTGVIPTTEGKILYDHIKNMFNDLNTTINTLEQNKNENFLYIGATTTNFLELISDSLKKFRKLHPNVHISIVLEEINVLSDMSKLSKLDIVIKNNYEVIDNFSKIKSFYINDKIIASKKYYKELADRKYSLEELLNNYPFVLLSTITHGRRNFNRYLQSLNIDYKPTYEFNSYSLCRRLISDGFGIGIGNPIHYKNEEFIIVDTDFKIPSRKFDIGYINTSDNKSVKQFIDILKEQKDI